MTDGADRPAQRPVLGDLAAEQLASQVLTHAGCVSTRQDQPIELVGLDVRPRNRRAELLIGLHLCVESLWFGGRAELSEDHAVEQPLVGPRLYAATLSCESHDMASACQEPPRHGDLGDVEVTVRHGDQNGGDQTTLRENVKGRGMPDYHPASVRMT